MKSYSIFPSVKGNLLYTYYLDTFIFYPGVCKVYVSGHFCNGIFCLLYQTDVIWIWIDFDRNLCAIISYCLKFISDIWYLFQTLTAAIVSAMYIHTVNSLIEDVLLFNIRILEARVLLFLTIYCNKFREITFLRASIQDLPLFEKFFY